MGIPPKIIFVKPIRIADDSFQQNKCQETSTLQLLESTGKFSSSGWRSERSRDCAVNLQMQVCERMVTGPLT
jgi:hypothetical protein